MPAETFCPQHGWRRLWTHVLRPRCFRRTGLARTRYDASCLSVCQASSWPGDVAEAFDRQWRQMSPWLPVLWWPDLSLEL